MCKIAVIYLLSKMGSMADSIVRKHSFHFIIFLFKQR